MGTLVFHMKILLNIYRWIKTKLGHKIKLIEGALENWNVYSILDDTGIIVNFTKRVIVLVL